MSHYNTVSHARTATGDNASKVLSDHRYLFNVWRSGNPYIASSPSAGFNG